MSKITRLQAENFKKLRVIDVHPGPGVVDVRGRNAQGKSSTLDAIQAALGGKRVMPSRPVRAGEDEGAVRIELDNGTVILRRFTSEGGDTLEVTNGEGFKAGSPQKLLDTLYTSVAFDPLAFTRMEPKDQLARLRGLVTLDVDVDGFEAANKRDYEFRRDKNREQEREAGRLRDMPTFPDAPKAKVDEAALEETIATAAEFNGQIERRRVNREEFGRAIQRNKGLVTDRQASIAELEEQLQQQRAGLAELEVLVADQEKQLAEAEPLAEAVDVSDVQQQLRTARETNRQVDAQAVFVGQGALVERLERESKELTDNMDRRKDDIADAIGRADMPVPGLGFGDGEVLFNDLPLSQASSAEQLRVSTAIGMAQAPKLRVMLVRDGSLLDDEGERILADLAEQQDFQLWIEAVDTSGKVGIVLEDGAVAAVDGEPPAEPEAIGKPKRRPAKKPSEESPLEQQTETRTVLAKVDGDKVVDAVVLDSTDDAAIAAAAEQLGGTVDQVEDLRPVPEGADEDGVVPWEDKPAAPEPAPTPAKKPDTPSLFD